jgi:hypothetical protein
MINLLIGFAAGVIVTAAILCNLYARTDSKGDGG